MYRFQKYPNLRLEVIYRLLCDILRDLNLHYPKKSKYDTGTLDQLIGLSAEDWSLLTRMAELEGVAPLIHWAVNGSQELRSSWNKETYKRLQQAYFTSMARNIILMDELEHISQVLDEANIPVIVLKGAALAQTIYKDIGLRPMNDLDLLVRQEHLSRALDLILELGYQRYEYSVHGVFENQVGHAVPLVHNVKTGVEIEIHWRLAGGEASLFQPQMEWFWENAQRWQSLSNNYSILSTPAHLLFLCAHLGLQHGLGKGNLIWLMDIYQLSKRISDNIEWDTFVRQAEIFGWSAAAYYVLQATCGHFGIEFPTGLLSDLRSQMQPQEENLVRAKSIVGKNIAVDVLTNLMGLRSTARFKTLKSYLVPSPEFMRQRYQVRSNWVLPWYYLYRWWNMSIKLIGEIRMKREAKSHT